MSFSFFVRALFFSRKKIMVKSSAAYFETSFLDYTQEKQHKVSILVVFGLRYCKKKLI